MNDFFLDAISKLSKAKREMMSTIVSKKKKWNIVALIAGEPNSAKFRGGCRFGKGGVTKIFEFLRDKNMNFLEFLC